MCKGSRSQWLEPGVGVRRAKEQPLGELSTGTVETWKDRIVLVERALGGKRVVVEVSTDKPTLTVDQKTRVLGDNYGRAMGRTWEPLLAPWGGHWVQGGGSL